MGDVGLWSLSVGPDHDDDAAADETDKDRSLPFGFVTTTGLRNGPRDGSLDEAMVRICTRMVVIVRPNYEGSKVCKSSIR
jgi:hypothetical protein